MFRFCFQLSCVAALLCLAVPVSAEEIQISEEMVVTASQIELPKSALGSAITVITSADIEKRGITFISDLLREVPGFAVSRNGSFGTLTDVRVRGAEANHTLVLIDGIEVNDTAISSSFNFGLLSSANIERVEIIRGSQSALWGSDAIGAVINIITRKGQGPLSLRASLEGGSFDTVKTSVGSSYGNEYINYNVNAEVLRTDGTNIARTGAEEDGHHNRTYDLKLGITPLDILSFDFVVRHVDSDTDTDPQPFPSPVVVDAAGNKTSVDQTYLKGDARLSLLNERWNHRIGIESSKTRNRFLSSTFGPSFNNGKREKYAYQTDFGFDTPQIGTSHHSSFLFEYQDDRAIGTFIGGVSEVGFISKSYAFEHHAAILERFFVTAGVRFDNNEFFDNAKTYRVAGAYKHHETNTRLHASYGTGVKNPTISELFGAFPTFTGNPNLRPESSKGWDVGIEQQLFNDRLLFDFTYFRNDITDQITGFIFGGFNTVANSSGTNRIYGIETTIDANLTRDLSLSGAYTYTHANDSNGLELIRRARHIGSVNLNYSLLDSKANINLGVNYNGRQEDNIFTAVTTRTTLGAFTVLNLNASYQVNNAIQLYARIENLLDESYEEIFSYQAPGIGGFAGIKVGLNP